MCVYKNNMREIHLENEDFDVFGKEQTFSWVQSVMIVFQAVRCKIYRFVFSVINIINIKL